MPDQDETTHSSRTGLATARSKHRRWTRVLLVTIVVVVLLAGGGYVGLVQFRGYCNADFLPVEAELDVPPYVQNLTVDAATIMWRTPDETDGRVAFGETPELDRMAQGDTTDVHAVRLMGLQPDTEYYYRASSSGMTYETQSFRTPPGPQGEITITVVGDTGTGETPQRRLADVMIDMNPDLVLHTGDVVYPRGGACHYEERYYDPYQELIDSVPIYPVLGNHDVLTDNGEPYLTAFGLPVESSGNERFYSFDYGPIHVAALDSELYYEDGSFSTEEQKAWLVEDLRSTDRPWKVVVIHRPPYSSSPYHGGDRQILEDLVGIFQAEGVDVVFAGHEHVYERLKPIDGITYFVTGGGGGDLRSAGVSELTAVSELQYHALEVQVDPERLLVEAVGVNGEVFDQVELTEPGDDRGSGT